MRIIAGRLGGRKLAPVRGDETRPALEKVRGALFDMLEPDLPDARVLDLFAGCGSLGLEALSRGAAHVTAVERSRGALDSLRASVTALGVTDQVELVARDAFRLQSEELPARGFDLVLLDPPFALAGSPELALLLQRAATCWLAPDGLLVLRLPSAAVVPAPQPGMVRLRDRVYGDSRLLIDHLRVFT